MKMQNYKIPRLILASLGFATPFYKGGIGQRCVNSPFEKGGGSRSEPGDFVILHF